MRTRVNSIFISSVLFTVALVGLIPNFWVSVITKRLAKLDSGDRSAFEARSDLSIVCLVIVLIGLIVVWKGYIKRVRWTWGVMFIVVWVWAFPLFLMPLLGVPRSLSIPEWIYTAISYPGIARAYAEGVLLFLLMVIALFLPVRSFFVAGEEPQPIHRLSPQLIGGSATAVLLIMIALSAWIRLSPYEISDDALTSWQLFPPPQFPPPPPPPNWDRCAPGGN
jgi:hypothetical protein